MCLVLQKDDRSDPIIPISPASCWCWLWSVCVRSGVGTLRWTVFILCGEQVGTITPDINEEGTIDDRERACVPRRTPQTPLLSSRSAWSGSAGRGGSQATWLVIGQGVTFSNFSSTVWFLALVWRFVRSRWRFGYSFGKFYNFESAGGFNFFFYCQV